MVKTGLILAGGKGTRMGKLTKDVPKCLLKIGKFAILSHLYTQLRISKLEKSPTTEEKFSEYRTLKSCQFELSLISAATT